MNELKSNIGKKRWESLNNNIKSTIDRIKGVEAPDDFPRVTILSLLEALQAFAESQFYFFHIGFYGQDGDAENGIERKAPYLEESKTFLPEYVLRKTLYQIEYDLSVIKQTIDQRLNGNEGEKLALKQADVLAYRCLQPAIDKHENDANLVANTAVITYFSKVAQVRVIPYAPIALVGLPYSAIDALFQGVGLQAANGDAPLEKNHRNDETNIRDFLAIPHEIGHYVYWHGRLGSSRLPITLSNRLRQRLKWLERWIEEIFADIYGALIVGPAMALNFQELQKDFFPPAKFIEDDRKHPIPAIRPYIYTYALSKVEFDGEKAFEEITKVLDDSWNGWLESYDVPKEFTPPGTNEPIKIDELPMQIKTIIDVAYKALRLNRLRKKKDDFWSKGNEIGGLFAEFADYVEALTENIEEEIENLPKVTVEDTQDTKILKIDGETWAELGKTGLAIDALKDGPKNNSNVKYKMLPEAWLIVFSMRRWTIAGPTGNPPTGT